MRKSSYTFIVLVFIGVALIMGVQPNAVEGQTTQADRQVFAFYFGWWTSEAWADTRLIDQPTQLYDVRSGTDMGGQIESAQSVGIDAFILDWLGPGNVTDETFSVMLDQSAAHGFSTAVVVDMNERDYMESMESVSAAMALLLTERIHHPGYLRVDGKPIIYFWNQERFTIRQWQQIRDQYDPTYQTTWIIEGTNPSYIPTFQGMYLFNTTFSDDAAALMQYWQNRTELAGGSYFVPTAMPGWNESAFAGWRSNATSIRDRRDGEFLRESWNAATSTGEDILMIVSWNGYFENSHIEPSQTYGTGTTDVLRELIAGWKSA